MAIVLVEGGYRNVKTVYMRNTGPDPMLVEVGLPEDIWTLFDEDGRKCICASDRSRLFYWVHDHEISLVTVQ